MAEVESELDVSGTRLLWQSCSFHGLQNRDRDIDRQPFFSLFLSFLCLNPRAIHAVHLLLQTGRKESFTAEARSVGTAMSADAGDGKYLRLCAEVPRVDCGHGFG